jgi:hypothetical protein
MHRSGTSAAARVINLLGVPVNRSDDWLAPRPQNPKGYWESSALLNANDRLFALLGCDCWSPPDLPAGWERDTRLSAFREEARAALRTVFTTPQWVWKDPRNCITFPFWADLVDRRSVAVFIYRNPLEVSCSLEAATAETEPLPKPLRLALWERYVRATLANMAGLPVLITSYADLMEETASWCEATSSFLEAHGITLDIENATGPISAFLERRLRHSHFTPYDFGEDPDISGAQVRLFNTLEASRGAYASFELLELPPETSWTEPLLAERRRMLQHRQAA